MSVFEDAVLRFFRHYDGMTAEEVKQMYRYDEKLRKERDQISVYYSREQTLLSAQYEANKKALQNNQ